MSSDPDKDITALTFDPEFQTENIAFDRGKMITCECGRTNPPNRLNCLYCGRRLDIHIDNAALIKTNRRKLEMWERGYNVILHEATTDDAAINKIAALLSMETADAAAILEANETLPLARVENEKEASIITNALTQLGLRCSVVLDETLAADKPPTRLSKIDDLGDDLAFTDFNTAEVINIPKEDLALIVPGILASGQVDWLEKKRRGKEPKLLEETTTTTDEAILDVYARNDANGYRIRVSGFDFSCLGENKGLLAAENMRSLTHFLKERSPNAKVITNYLSIKSALSIVWEIESRKDSKGLVRTGFGKSEFGAIATTNNLHQFTKYSRLQWHLL